MHRLLQLVFFVLFVRPLLALILGVNLRHAERLPQSGPVILAANHNSHLDTLLLMSLTPLAQLHRVRPVAAADYFLRNRVVAWFARHIMHILPLSRRPKPGEKPLAHIEAALAEGDILILFPEGSRGEPEKRSALKSGIAHLMETAPTVPVVPIYLRGLGKALPKGDWLPIPFFADGWVGEPLTWQGSRAATMQALETRFVELEREGHAPAWE
ncbi:MAG: 1-acyl-sn-glycerol-3-phosphate acyltransferase [Hydrogenophilales bacterium 16-64-46]|nr:MAG: 1-acyl-sn-glycerol-3-phosphate acyltransferase [Hydrogenophilales bacterium 12-64-13]OYZ05375.1 MAG: 1-acyl-sn-glycerol-3-phosphate acyltransferase [Hydrogenophilales bacterium 16-64-46]OZA37164.1 MAG: 1-acyl-sn-glycerol-3-phosphate acyltransferase [Hydrogenophilales bacterium 17-64-34]HQS99371.1 lysophospholipid acyltransferase family protein [Thiobacillus sp.]